MSTPEDHIAAELRQELDARVITWKAQRAQLIRATTRIAELDGLIAYAEDSARTHISIPLHSETVIVEQPTERGL